MTFSNSKQLADSLMEKAKLVARGETMVEAYTDLKWMTSYVKITQRSDQGRRYGLSCYPYEPRPSIDTFLRGFFDHLD